MEQSSRTTGAIGDINNDGKLDLVLTFNAQGTIKNTQGNYIRTESSLDLIAIELELGYTNYPLLKNGKIVKADSKSHTKWKSKASQKWTGYMGNDSFSLYRS